MDLNATCAGRACAACGDEAVAEQLQRLANQGYPVLTVAASSGHHRAVERLLLLSDVDMNRRNRLGCTPLFMAALKGHDRVVELLLGREDVQVSLYLFRVIFESNLVPLTCFINCPRDGGLELLSEVTIPRQSYYLELLNLKE